VEQTITKTELDLAPPGGSQTGGYTFESTETLLAVFDKNVATGRAILQKTADADLNVP